MKSKEPELLIKKGEPLLLLTCYQDISREVLTLDLHRRTSVPAKLLDHHPKSFVLPEAPVLWDFDAHKAFVFATPEDKASVPGAVEAQKLEEKCADKGLDACVKASQKVKAEPWRPGQDARADKACDLAKNRAINDCMGGKAGKERDAIAHRLDDLRRARAVKEFETLKAKFAAK